MAKADLLCAAEDGLIIDAMRRTREYTMVDYVAEVARERPDVGEGGRYALAEMRRDADVKIREREELSDMIVERLMGSSDLRDRVSRKLTVTFDLAKKVDPVYATTH